MPCAVQEKDIRNCSELRFYDLLNIFSMNGVPSQERVLQQVVVQRICIVKMCLHQENPYLFNGDFVDRGSFSVEAVLATAYGILRPDRALIGYNRDLWCGDWRDCSVYFFRAC